MAGDYSYRKGDRTFVVSRAEKGVWFLGVQGKPPYAKFHSKRNALRFLWHGKTG